MRKVGLILRLLQATVTSGSPAEVQASEEWLDAFIRQTLQSWARRSEPGSRKWASLRIQIKTSLLQGD
jgi:hypothetical protein